MATTNLKVASQPLVVQGRNAAGKLITGVIPAGQMPTEDPGLAIQKILAKHREIRPTPIMPE